MQIVIGAGSHATGDPMRIPSHNSRTSFPRVRRPAALKVLYSASRGAPTTFRSSLPGSGRLQGFSWRIMPDKPAQGQAIFSLLAS